MGIVRLRRKVLLCLLTLSCVLGKAGNATNEVVNALQPAAQASPEATPRRAATNEVAADTGALLPALGEASQGERDPFWPIGYVSPSKHGGTVAPAKTNAVESGKETTKQVSDLSGMLKIGGVIRSGGRFYANINGFTVQTGEVVTAVADGEVYKFVVVKIDFKKVQIRPVK